MARGTAADGGVPESYAELVRALSERLSAAPDDQAVWEVYSETERLIALMRFRLGHETPGRFAKLPAASETDGLVARARALLAQAAGEIARGDALGSIATLREARNHLRGYLTQKRRGPRGTGRAAGT